MSLRFVVMLSAGVLAMGPVAVVGAPSAMDVIATEPAEDLFATKPADPEPGATSPTVSGPPAAAPERAPAAGPPPRAIGDNPLWAIPLARLTATRERPLFAPTRRPPVVAPVAIPAPPPGPPPKPPEPEMPQLSLLGTVIGAEKIGLFLDARSKSVVRLRAGENHNGWTLRAVERRRVELARGLDQAVLDLPAPDMKASGTAGAPMLAGQPPTPAAPPAMAAPVPTPPPPVAASGGTYVHPGANMNLPIGRAMPANLRLPPGLVNPLANQGPR